MKSSKDEVAKPDLVCSIKSDKKAYEIGEKIHIAVQIRNNTDKTVNLVKLLDGSGERMRYPYGYFEIKRNGKEYDLHEGLMRCGNMDGISIDDFAQIKPMQSFDPYLGQPNIYFVTPNSFNNAGRYKIIFYYSTKQTDIKEWLGDLSRFYYDNTGEPRPENKNKLDSLLRSFNEVPKVELISNELAIDVE